MKWLLTGLIAVAAMAQEPYYTYSMATEVNIRVEVLGMSSLLYPSVYMQEMTIYIDQFSVNKGALSNIPNGNTTITVTARGSNGSVMVDLYRGSTNKMVQSLDAVGFLITLINLNQAPLAENNCPIITSVTLDPGKAKRTITGDTPNPSRVTIAADTVQGGNISSTGFTNKLPFAHADTVIDGCGDADDLTYCFTAGATETLGLHEFDIAVTDDHATNPCTQNMDVSIEIIQRTQSLVIDFAGLQPYVISMNGDRAHVMSAQDILTVNFNVEATGPIVATGHVTCGAHPINPIKDGNNDFACADPSDCTITIPFQGRAENELCVAEVFFTDSESRVSTPVQYTFYSGYPSYLAAPHITFAFVSDVEFVIGNDFSMVVNVEDPLGDLTQGNWQCGDMADNGASGGSYTSPISTFTHTAKVANTTAPQQCIFSVSRGGVELVKTFNFNTPFPVGYPTPVPTPLATCTLSTDACVHGQIHEVSGPGYAYITAGQRPSSVNLTAGAVIVIHTTEAVAFHASVPPAIVAALNACGEIEAHVESVTYDTSQNVRVMGISRIFYDDVWHNDTAIFTDTQLTGTSFRVVAAPLASSGYMRTTSVCTGELIEGQGSQLLTVPEYALGPVGEACHMEEGVNITRAIVDVSAICYAGWIVHNDLTCETSNVIGLTCDDQCMTYGTEYIQVKGTDGSIQFYSDTACTVEVPGKSLPETGDLHNYVPSAILENGMNHYALVKY